MIKGLYQSASAMLPRIKEQEIIANNLANVSTSGYKKDAIFTEEMTRAQIKNSRARTDWEIPVNHKVYTEHSQGTLDKTNNPLDIALDGEGLFVLQTIEGMSLYTRAGVFTVNQAGFITNPSGHLLIGDGGPINVGEGPVSISEAGEVEVAGEAVGKIMIVDVNDKSSLMKAGETDFILPENVSPTPVINCAVKQGYLETSNVDITRDMVDMIISFRLYEADANALKTQDESLEKLMENVGRVR